MCPGDSFDNAFRKPLKGEPMTTRILYVALIVAFASPPSFAQEPRWQVQNSGVTSDLGSVSFVNDQLGFAAGSNGIILRTKDGGKKWQTVLEDAKKVGNLGYIQFTDAKNGWGAYGILGAIVQTKDGGDSWKIIPIPAGIFPGSAFSNISPVGSGCYLQYIGGVYHSAAGQPWRLLNKASLGRGSQDWGGVSMVNDTFGAVSWSKSNARYTVAITTDGGKTWTEKDVTDKKVLRGQSLSVQFVDLKTGWLYSGYGKLLATIDGGKSWMPQDPGQDENAALTDLHFVNTTLGHLLTFDNKKEIAEVRRTTDGGKSWRVLGQLHSKGPVQAVRFVDENNGWVVGDKGYIERFGK
jgi:photosystem II stability/assembly factor-like uncharacterized protein